MHPTAVELLAAGLFAAAVLHTFSAKLFERLAHRVPQHAGLLHLLGEVEVVFGFWAIILVFTMAFMSGGAEALAYAETRNYTEPLFVFVVMVIAGSRPVLQAVRGVIDLCVKLMPMPAALATAWLGLAVRCMLGDVTACVGAERRTAITWRTRQTNAGMETASCDLHGPLTTL